MQTLWRELRCGLRMSEKNPGFITRGALLFGGAHHTALLFQAEHHAVNGLFEITHFDRFGDPPRGQQQGKVAYRAA